MLTLKEKIIECLIKFPGTRNDDIQLTSMIVYKYHNSEMKEIDGKIYTSIYIQRLIRQANVKRIRAFIQNVENRYLPTDLKVVKRRKINETTWRNYMMIDNPSLG